MKVRVMNVPAGWDWENVAGSFTTITAKTVRCVDPETWPLIVDILRGGKKDLKKISDRGWKIETVP